MFKGWRWGGSKGIPGEPKVSKMTPIGRQRGARGGQKEVQGCHKEAKKVSRGAWSEGKEDTEGEKYGGGRP